MSTILIPWFLTMFPLTFSPGPANMMFAATGAQFGFKKTLPLLLGINLVCIVLTLAIGFGMGEILFRYPVVAKIAKYLGAAFMVYLALKFFKSTKLTEANAKAPSFIDGVVLELLNFKFLMIPTVMFSQFLDPKAEKIPQIIALTIGLNFINIAGHFIWISAGNFLTRKLKSEKAIRTQGIFFGSMLVGVAAWMVLV